MYVVRRTFRNFGKMITPGSIVEPGNIKRFKFRLTNGYIVNVSEHDFDKWREYFKVRFGVEIAATGGIVDDSVDLTGDTEPAEEAKSAEEAKPVKEAKPATVKVAKVVTPK